LESISFPFYKFKDGPTIPPCLTSESNPLSAKVSSGFQGLFGVGQGVNQATLLFSPFRTLTPPPHTHIGGGREETPCVRQAAPPAHSPRPPPCIGRGRTTPSHHRIVGTTIPQHSRSLGLGFADESEISADRFATQKKGQKSTIIF